MNAKSCRSYREKNRGIMLGAAWGGTGTTMVLGRPGGGGRARRGSSCETAVRSVAEDSRDWEERDASSRRGCSRCPGTRCEARAGGEEGRREGRREVRVGVES
jgi:hypothetical protein